MLRDAQREIRRPELMLRRPKAGIGSNRFPSSNFKHFSLSFQSSFHLSLTVLVCYRSLADI